MFLVRPFPFLFPFPVAPHAAEYRKNVKLKVKIVLRKRESSEKGKFCITMKINKAKKGNAALKPFIRKISVSLAFAVVCVRLHEQWEREN